MNNSKLTCEYCLDIYPFLIIRFAEKNYESY